MKWIDPRSSTPESILTLGTDNSSHYTHSATGKVGGGERAQAPATTP